MNIQSYVVGEWFTGEGSGNEVFNAINGESIGMVSSNGVDFKEVLDYGRKAGESLRNMSLYERVDRLKAVGKHLMDNKEMFYPVSSWTGATRNDSWIDIEGAIGTLFSYCSFAKKELPDMPYFPEGDIEQFSKEGNFVGNHILVPREGVAVHINAFNFPCWGMLEKIVPSILAGMPVIVKPGTVSCYLTEVMFREMINAGSLPEGTLQLICGSTGDMLEHLTEQDVVTFTGSAATGNKLKTHPSIITQSVPFNMEADSLNCSILAETVEPGSAEFDLYIKEVVREMTIKAGQKCTAIRRAIVPANITDAVMDALKQRLDKMTLGDPAKEGVRMGALVGRRQVSDVWDNVRSLSRSCEIVYGGKEEFELQGGDKEKGAFFPKTLLFCNKPFSANEPHSVEAFGPVSTVLPYNGLDEAIELAKMGRGSLVGSVVTANKDEAKKMLLGMASFHGRLLVLDAECGKESTGHGTPLPRLIHGGPGRAGGGEELGGIRAIKHYMQRCAIQGSPSTLAAITQS